MAEKDIRSLALTSYGNFTTMLVTEQGVRGLGLHLQRLEQDAELLFEKRIEAKRVKHLLKQAVSDGPKPAIARVTIFCPEFDLARPANPCAPDILVTTRPAPLRPLPPLSLQPVTYQRDMPEIKSMSIGGALYRRRLAQRDGFDDALFVNEQGDVAEGPTWSIGFVKSGQIIVPASPSLPSVTETFLQKALPIQIANVNLSDVSSMDAAFVMNAVNGIRAVSAIGLHTFEQSKELVKLKAAYEKSPYEQL